MSDKCLMSNSSSGAHFYAMNGYCKCGAGAPWLADVNELSKDWKQRYDTLCILLYAYWVHPTEATRAHIEACIAANGTASVQELRNLRGPLIPGCGCGYYVPSPPSVSRATDEGIEPWIIRTGDLYWRENGNGYTRHLYDAGLFSEADAKRKGIRKPPNDSVRDEPMPLSAFRSELDDIRSFVARVSQPPAAPPVEGQPQDESLCTCGHPRIDHVDFAGNIRACWHRYGSGVSGVYCACGDFNPAARQPPAAPSVGEAKAADEDHLDIYVPGVLRCLTCQFELTTATLFVQSGEVGLTRDQALGKHEGEPCPNDGTPMVKVRWAERAQQNYEAYGALMNEIIGIVGISRECDNLPAALQILKERSAPVGDVSAIRALVTKWRERSAMSTEYEHRDPSTAVAGAHHASAFECQRCADELDALLPAQDGGQ